MLVRPSRPTDMSRCSMLNRSPCCRPGSPRISTLHCSQNLFRYSACLAVQCSMPLLCAPFAVARAFGPRAVRSATSREWWYAQYLVSLMGTPFSAAMRNSVSVAVSVALPSTRKAFSVVRTQRAAQAKTRLEYVVREVTAVKRPSSCSSVLITLRVGPVRAAPTRGSLPPVTLVTWPSTVVVRNTSPSKSGVTSYSMTARFLSSKDTRFRTFTCTDFCSPLVHVYSRVTTPSWKLSVRW
mmetsp:Transcript_139717/g.243159  ORF Transcript_139717/g.243159 Transcript_139717/m.243159 type:complete len:239 (-) Transcript_139717:2528-3244(-)